MVSEQAKKLIRDAFKSGAFRGFPPKRSAILHMDITERGEMAKALAENVNDGTLGIHWIGRQYCDANGEHVSYKSVRPAPKNIRELDAWVDATDPWIEGPCSWTLFRPSDTQAGTALGYF